MGDRIRIKGDTAANWTANNPLLLSREIAIETDTKRIKIGNGTDDWNSLDYMVTFPAHEWDGSQIQFENPDGSPGGYVDLAPQLIPSLTVLNPEDPPDIDVVTTPGGPPQIDVEFKLPRAAVVSVPAANPIDNGQDPAVNTTVTDGDVELQFDLPRSKTVVLESFDVINPNQDPTVTDTGDVNAMKLEIEIPRAADVSIGNVGTLNNNQSPTVNNSGTNGDVVLDFALPQAKTVTLGSVNVTIPNQNPAITDSGDVNEAVFDFQIPRAPAVTIGTITPVNPDQNPSISNSGTEGDVVLDFDLPNAPSFEIGDVTTVGANDPAVITNVGVNGNIKLDFEIPQGQTGSLGAITGFPVADLNDTLIFPAQSEVSGDTFKVNLGDAATKDVTISPIHDGFTTPAPVGRVLKYGDYGIGVDEFSDPIFAPGIFSRPVTGFFSSPGDSRSPRIVLANEFGNGVYLQWEITNSFNPRPLRILSEVYEYSNEGSLTGGPQELLHTGNKQLIREFFNVTVPSSAFSGSNPAIATITVNGILSTDEPIVDIDLSGVSFANVQSRLNDWASIYRIEASADDEIKLYSTSNVGANLDINLAVFR